VHDLGASPTLRGVDDVHQHLAIPFLRGLFPDTVLGAIGGHVDAKRYLCATRPGYEDSLSADSKRSLQLQGGVFSAAQAADFIARPGSAEAVRLREWDDLAKVGTWPRRRWPTSSSGPGAARCAPDDAHLGRRAGGAVRRHAARQLERPGEVQHRQGAGHRPHPPHRLLLGLPLLLLVGLPPPAPGPTSWRRSSSTSATTSRSRAPTGTATWA
jgi:hypothetical protein